MDLHSGNWGVIQEEKKVVIYDYGWVLQKEEILEFKKFFILRPQNDLYSRRLQVIALLTRRVITLARIEGLRSATPRFVSNLIVNRDSEKP